MGYKLVCLRCQKAYNQDSNYEERAKESLNCPECSQIAIPYPHRFRPPSKSDKKAWDVVRFLYDCGFKYEHISNPGETSYIKYPQTMREAREFVDKQKSG